MIFNMTGGGAALNFKVVGGTTQPVAASENTIWVNTATPVTNYEFSATQPVGEAGVVWFKTGTHCAAPFNVLKKGAIMVYPTSARQLIDGEWVGVEAKTYQGGAWIDWVRFIFNNGVVEGGSWTGVPTSTYATITTTGPELKMDCPPESSETNYVAYMKLSESIATNDAKTLKIHFTRLAASNGNSNNCPLSISLNGGSSYVKQYTDISLDDLSDNTIALDISTLSSVTIWFKSHLWKSLNSSCYLTIDQIWFE